MYDFSKTRHLLNFLIPNIKKFQLKLILREPGSRSKGIVS